MQNDNETLFLVGGLALAYYLYTTRAGATGTVVNPNTGATAPAGYYYQYNPQTGQYQLMSQQGNLTGYGAPVTPTSATFPPPAAPNGYYYQANPYNGAYQLMPNPLGGGNGIQQSVLSALGGSIGNLFSGIFSNSSAPGNNSPGTSSFQYSPLANTQLPSGNLAMNDYSVPNPSSDGLNYQVGGMPLNYSTDLSIPGLSLNQSNSSYSGYGS